MLIVLAIIIVNAAGLLLRYFELDRFVIILGFRFHLSLILPFLLLLFKKPCSFVIDKIKANPFRNLAAFFAAIVLPLLVFATAYFLDYFDLTDPDYFYEFGISSIIDFPIYFLWNLLQFAMIIIFLHYVTRNIKFSMPVIFGLLLLFFAYEFIPLGKDKFVLTPVLQFSSVCFVAAIIISFIKNIYVSALLIFSLLWTSVLILGSSYAPIIKIIFAKNFDSWEGFLKISKKIPEYSFLYYFGTALIFLVFYIMINSLKRKN